MRILFIMLAAAIIVSCTNQYSRVATFAEADDTQPLTAVDLARWDDVAESINAAWGSTDLRYSRSLVPQLSTNQNLSLVAWRGERVSAQLLIWTAHGLDGVNCSIGEFRSEHATLPASIAQSRYVRYTLSHPNYIDRDSVMLSPDMLDSLVSFDIAPRSVRPVWLTISVPQDAKAGIYASEVVISHNGSGELVLPFTLEVQKYGLDSPDKWIYHLDLWQHPTSVARAEGLELWSDAHFEALKRNMTLLANAGQKVVTATLNKDPWNHQCYDSYEPMIKWVLKDDGEWMYDYTIFDRWVEMMISLGIDKMINCYSMVPWNCELEYYDESKGEVVTVNAEPGTPEFAAMWRPFLLDFKEHLEHKGWLSITNIAMDERAPEAMDAAVMLLAECAPEMGFAIADMHKSYKRYLNMRDVCVAQEQPADCDDIVLRRNQGYTTTFYVCCNPSFPNTFSFSHPYEAELLGWYGLSCDYDGMLRWAYNSWPENPQYDSRFGNWSSADTFLIYPYARSSIRFERLIDGIEIAEKVRTLRRMCIDTREVEAILAIIRSTNVNDAQESWLEIIDKAREALNSVSRR